MNPDRKPGKYGRNKPHPKETHPRVMLEDHVDFTVMPSPPASIDWASEVKEWPMYLNDQLGDCTCAEVGHAEQAWTAYASTEFTMPEQNILSLYETVGGYIPGNPSTDNGCVIQDVLQYMTSTGIGGHKYLAFAQLGYLGDMNKIYQVLDMFGSIYLGINCPDSAEAQFSKGEIWTYVPGATIVGGHAIALQKKNPDSTMGVVTWGALQQMDQSFWLHYVEEAWVAVTEDWFGKTGDTPTGLNMTSLMADFRSLS